jgi:hypothetical protein
MLPSYLALQLGNCKRECKLNCACFTSDITFPVGYELSLENLLSTSNSSR